MLDPEELEQARQLLCKLQDHIRQSILSARERASHQGWSRVAAVTAADTIYEIDKATEEPIGRWLKENWPSGMPVEIVMEGIEEDRPWTFPTGTSVETTRWKCIIDPIDGTRCLMYDKRSAWSLAALTPQRGAETNLSDIRVAAMTEIPTSKQWRADQLSAVRGCGRAGVQAQAVDVRDGSRQPLTARPSQATDFRHAFAGLSRFFPQGKGLTARIEEELWAELHGREPGAAPLVFEDQYISTGGQIYELAVGHDRMLGDLRPLVFGKLGLRLPLTCHPYDICTAMILTELGGVVEDPWGRPLNAPLDTTSPVAWMGYANETLASLARPVLGRLLEKHFGGAA